VSREDGAASSLTCSRAPSLLMVSSHPASVSTQLPNAPFIIAKHHYCVPPMAHTPVAVSSEEGAASSLTCSRAPLLHVDNSHPASLGLQHMPKPAGAGSALQAHAAHTELALQGHAAHTEIKRCKDMQHTKNQRCKGSACSTHRVNAARTCSTHRTSAATRVNAAGTCSTHRD